MLDGAGTGSAAGTSAGRLRLLLTATRAPSGCAGRASTTAAATCALSTGSTAAAPAGAAPRARPASQRPGTAGGGPRPPAFQAHRSTAFILL